MTRRGATGAEPPSAAPFPSDPPRLLSHPTAHLLPQFASAAVPGSAPPASLHPAASQHHWGGGLALVGPPSSQRVQLGASEILQHTFDLQTAQTHAPGVHFQPRSWEHNVTRKLIQPDVIKALIKLNIERF